MGIPVRVMAAAAATLMLSGCLSGGSLANRGTYVDLGVGTMQNRGILLNLARASRSEPLYFLSPSAVQATGSTDLRAGLPALAEGPGLLVAQKQFTLGANGSNFLDNSISTNFTANLFATHDFYLGLMSPLTLDEIDLLLHQGHSRELIFYLVIDKAKVTPIGLDGKPSGPPHFVYNDPNDRTFSEFTDFIRAAMEHGLTTEVAPVPPAGAKPAPDVKVQPPAAGQAQTVVVVQTTDQAAKKDAPARQICYEEALVAPSAMADFQKLALLLSLQGRTVTYCGQPAPQTAPTTAAPEYVLLKDKTGAYQNYEIQVVFRSTDQIFHYLGRLMNDPVRPELVNYAADYPNGLPEDTPTGSLFVVSTSGGGSCFVQVQYEDKTYCAPGGDGDGAETTREVFDVLTELVALKQSAGDIPASSAILIP